MSMNIWIVSTIDIGFLLTSGRHDSTAPSRATTAIAPTKIDIAVHCPRESCLPMSVVVSP